MAMLLFFHPDKKMDQQEKKAASWKTETALAAVLKSAANRRPISIPVFSQRETASGFPEAAGVIRVFDKTAKAVFSLSKNPYFH